MVIEGDMILQLVQGVVLIILGVCIVMVAQKLKRN